MSLLKDVLERGEIAITAEIAPPKGTDFSHLIECANALRSRVHGINVTDFQSAVLRVSSLATCIVLKEQGFEPVLQITGRDRNRIAIEGELLSAGVFNIENLLALTGDYTVIGDHPNAKPVYDLDSVGILQAASMLNNGTDTTLNELSGKPNFFLGACATPRYDPIELQIMKMEKKIKSGAKFFQTQAVFDIETMRNFRKMTRHLDCKILAGIIPLKSPGMAVFMNKNVPGIYVPDELIERVRNAENKIKEGIKIAGEFIRQIKDEKLCDGIHIMAIGAEENVPFVLDEAGL